MLKIDSNEKIVIILAHLDDEFALAPLIKRFPPIQKKNLQFIYCAERLDSKKSKILKRRIENKKSLKYLGISSKQIIYLNDYFLVDDLKLYIAKSKIITFLDELRNEINFKKIFSLACEGGNPDHDFLSLIIYAYSKNNNLKAFFFPAYNYERFLFFPFKVLSSLNNQATIYRNINLGKLCWLDSIIVALIYKSELFAFMKLVPFIICKLFISDSISFSNEILPSTINWQKSLTYRIYNFDIDIIKKQCESLSCKNS